MTSGGVGKLVEGVAAAAAPAGAAGSCAGALYCCGVGSCAAARLTNARSMAEQSTTRCARAGRIELWCKPAIMGVAKPQRRLFSAPEVAKMRWSEHLIDDQDAQHDRPCADRRDQAEPLFDHLARRRPIAVQQERQQEEPRGARDRRQHHEQQEVIADKS